MYCVKSQWLDYFACIKLLMVANNIITCVGGLLYCQSEKPGHDANSVPNMLLMVGLNIRFIYKRTQQCRIIGRWHSFEICREADKLSLTTAARTLMTFIKNILRPS